MTTSEKECAICSIPHDEHVKLEQRGLKKHKFSQEGEFLEVEKKKSEKQQSNRPIIQVIPAPDLPLRALLKNKGILTDDDLAALDMFKVVVQTEVPGD